MPTIKDSLQILLKFTAVSSDTNIHSTTSESAKHYSLAVSHYVPVSYPSFHTKAFRCYAKNSKIE